jgi:cupin domain
MVFLFKGRAAALVLAASMAACTDSSDSVGPRVQAGERKPVATTGSGSVSTLLGRATFGDESAGLLEIARTTGSWSVDIEAQPNLDVAVQSIIFEPGGQSGWHSHPGPVFIQVVGGTMTFYEGDDPTCSPIVRTKGQGYLDRGDHPHIARNETELHAQTVVTYFAPQGAALRIDEPNPGNCPF